MSSLIINDIKLAKATGKEYWSEDVNLKRSNEYIINDRKQRLHIRSYWSDANGTNNTNDTNDANNTNDTNDTNANDDKCKAIVLFLHGYASHCNRPLHKYISNEMNNNDNAYITIDVTGHGYSDGTKGYIDNSNDCVDDVLTLLIHLYATTSNMNDHHLKKKGKRLPLFIIGHSFGGAIATLVASILSNPNDYYNVAQTPYSIKNSDAINDISPLFKGLMLLAPAIKMTLPPVIRFTLDYVLSTLLPYNSVPGSNDNDKVNPKDVWASDDYYDYIINDGYPTNPKGLSWGPRIRTRSCSVLFDMSEKSLSTASSISYPFIIFHDPNDSIVKINGVRSFYQQAATSSDKKVLEEMVDGLHDPLFNRLEYVVDKLLTFIQSNC